MAKTKNKILSFVGGLLGGAAAGGADEKNIELEDVVKVTKKFGESMEDFLDTEYNYLTYLRNRNGGGTGVGGFGGERGSKTKLDHSRYRKSLKGGGGGLPLLPPRRPSSKNVKRVKTKVNRRLLRATRNTNKTLFNKHGLSKAQIDAFRKARAKNIPIKHALQLAKDSARGGNVLTRQFDKIAANIPSRPQWLTKNAKWPGAIATKARKLVPEIKAPNILKNLKLKNLNPKNLLGKIPKPIRNQGGRMLTAAMAFLDFRHKTKNENKTTARALTETGINAACNTKGFMAAANATLPLTAPLMVAPEPASTISGGLIWFGAGIAGAMACSGIGNWASNKLWGDKGYQEGGPNNEGETTEKNRIGSVVGGGSGGSVITSPTRGILGGQKSLVGEAQEAELILPMSKIGDALSAVYREGASVMVGATISFLTPLSGSPAVASVLGQARKLQSIVGTSDIQAETPQVPEIKQVKVKASNTETNNTEQKFNSGGFVTGGTGIDKVPARLTAGEFVMSKGAVKKFGAGTLASMNAAGGGTNRPTPSGGYNQGGKSFDRSHYGTPGYQIGQINPPTLVLSREEYTDHSTERTGKERSWVQKNITERDFEKFTEYDGPILGKTRTKLEYREGDLVGTETYESDIASIGVPDLYEHKDQLLSAIHAVPGYGHVTIQDVINSKVDMPLKQYMMILMTSDAQAATFAKKDAAHQADLELRGIDPSKGYSMGYDMNGGGLVPPAISPSTETSNIKPRPKKNREQLNNTPINITKKAKVKASIVPIPIPKPVVITKQVVVEKPVLKNRTLIISDQGKGVLVS